MSTHGERGASLKHPSPASCIASLLSGLPSAGQAEGASRSGCHASGRQPSSGSLKTAREGLLPRSVLGSQECPDNKTSDARFTKAKRAQQSSIVGLIQTNSQRGKGVEVRTGIGHAPDESLDNLCPTDNGSPVLSKQMRSEHSRNSIDATPNFARAVQHASSNARHGESTPVEALGSPATLASRSQALSTKL